MSTARRVASVARYIGREVSPVRVYRQQYHRSPRNERMLIGSIAFFAGFGGARLVTYAIRRRIGPFHNLSIGGRHVHHLVFGIGGLLGVGYLWLLLVGTDHHRSRAVSNMTAAGFGLASALTLDEFALWINLQDVYWAKQGRQSIDAAAAFGGLLSVGIWGGPFIRGLLREVRLLNPWHLLHHGTPAE